jgi:hypothetical protein
VYICLKKKAEKLDNLEKRGPEDKKRYLDILFVWDCILCFSEQETCEAVILLRFLKMLSRCCVYDGNGLLQNMRIINSIRFV